MNTINSLDTSDQSNNSKGAPTSGEYDSVVKPDYSNSAPEEAKTDSASSSGRGLSGLYSITQELHSVENALIESEGQLSKDLEERLSAVTIAKEKKIDNYAAIMKRCESIIVERKELAESILKTAKAADSLLKYLKINLKDAAKSLGLDELVGETIRFKFTNSKPTMEVLDMNLIPDEYKKEITIFELKKDMLEKALSNGVEVPGIKWNISKTMRQYAVKVIK